jgi:hypothetical protein
VIVAGGFWLARIHGDVQELGTSLKTLSAKVIETSASQSDLAGDAAVDRRTLTTVLEKFTSGKKPANFDEIIKDFASKAELANEQAKREQTFTRLLASVEARRRDQGT